MNHWMKTYRPQLNIGIFIEIATDSWIQKWSRYIMINIVQNLKDRNKNINTKY